MFSIVPEAAMAKLIVQEEISDLYLDKQSRSESELTGYWGARLHVQTGLVGWWELFDRRAISSKKVGI